MKSNPLRLGAHHLVAAEAGLLRAQLRLMEVDNAADWSWVFADAPPYDAVIAQENSLDTARASSLYGAKAVLPLIDARSGHVTTLDALVRPLRVDHLALCLHRLQGLLAEHASGSEDVSQNARQGNSVDVRFKLIRWPPAQLLQNDTHRVRMATFLSRRRMSVPELAQMCHQSEGRCQTFVQLLQNFSLVEIQNGCALNSGENRSQMSTCTRQLTDRDAAMSSKPQAQASANWSLMRNIRQRLGL